MCLLKTFQLKLLTWCSIHAFKDISLLLVVQNLLASFLQLKKGNLEYQQESHSSTIIFKKEMSD